MWMTSKLRPVIRRADSNQSAINCELRSLSYETQLIHTIGKGCPDIIVPGFWRNWIFEIKAKDGKMTDDELVWHSNWIEHKGQVAPVYSTEEIIDYINRHKGE
jgi:hypothetical protein